MPRPARPVPLGPGTIESCGRKKQPRGGLAGVCVCVCGGGGGNPLREAGRPVWHCPVSVTPGLRHQASGACAQTRSWRLGFVPLGCTVPASRFTVAGVRRSGLPDLGVNRAFLCVARG